MNPASHEPDTYERVVSALKNLKASNRSLEQDCERLQLELTSLNNQKSALDAQLQQINEQLALDRTLEMENKDLGARVRELESDHENDAEKLLGLKRVLEETVVQLCNERKKKARIEAKTAKITANIRALTQVAESLEPKPEQIKENELLAKRIEDKKQKWHQHKTELRSVIQELRTKRDELSETVKDCQVQIDDRNALICQLEAKVERRNKAIEDLEQTLVVKSEEGDRVASQLGSIRTDVEGLKAKSQSLKETLKQNTLQLAANRKRFEKEKEKLSTAKCRMKHLQLSFAEKLRIVREEGEQETKAKLDELQRLDAEKDEEVKKAQEGLAAAKEKHESAAAALKKVEAARQNEKRKYGQAIEEFEARFQTMQKVILTFTQRSLSKDDF
jgi:chromosome segregation ATPase